MHLQEIFLTSIGLRSPKEFSEFFVKKCLLISRKTRKMEDFMDFSEHRIENDSHI